jgi:2-oxoglutarate dehydrogenase E2 component (dihydrolipoamide succinyltransferase)
MAHKIIVPELGESIVEASVLRWLKKEGDEVQAGDIVAELETDKVDVDVAAGAAGVLQRIDKQEGADVKIGDVLGEVEESSARENNGELSQDKKSKASDEKPGDGSEETESGEETDSAEDGESAGKTESANEPERDDSPDDASRITPLAAKLAREHKIDAGGIEGTGAGGKITKGDVERHIESRSGDDGGRRAGTGGDDRGTGAAAQPIAGERGEEQTVERREERKRMSRRRQTIAKRLVEAQQTAAILTTFNEIDMHAVLELRNAQKESFERRHGVKLGFMSFFVKAAVAALKEFPEINAELRGDEIVYKYYYDVGIAVGAEGGLVVPVLRDADKLSFAAVEKKIREMAAKADEGTLTVEELRGGTFSITNGGVYGSLLSTPILNPPQTGILGLHKIEERPVVKDGTVAVRPMMYVALSYDHRVVDGRESVQFLVRIKELIETPSAMLLDT